MYSWPSHFPSQCPPHHAEELAGPAFRFINKRSATTWDFMSHYERTPNGNWSANECNARGLSVLRAYEDCQAMREGVPALRKKRLIVANINISVGLIAKTPSRNCKNHLTWWRAILAEEAGVHFALFDEPMEPTNV